MVGWATILVVWGMRTILESIGASEDVEVSGVICAVVESPRSAGGAVIFLGQNMYLFTRVNKQSH